MTCRFGLSVPLEGRVREFPGPIRSYLVGQVATLKSNLELHTKMAMSGRDFLIVTGTNLSVSRKSSALK